MKVKQLKSLSIVALAATGFIACNPLNKMAKNAEDLQYTTTPNPIEMHGDSVEVTVNGTIPPKYFNKKVTATLKPYFKVDGNKVVEFDSLTLVGESADANGKKIDFENGGNYKLVSKVPYSKDMERGELWVTAVGKYKGKVKDIQDFKLADGTIITPLLVKGDDKPIIGADNFQRITTDIHKADIHFLINSAAVRGSELNDDDMKQLFEDIKAKATDSTFNFKSLAVEAYASPDGELSLNENLADNRAKAAASRVERELKRRKVEGATEEGFTATTGKGEDWAGFKTAMEASEIADKELIIRVLQMYQDPAKREAEIKNLAETYLEVKDQILPDLRRAQIALAIDKVGKSDDEIARLAAENSTALNVEELLYAATLTNDLDKKEDIYAKAVSQFGDDWRSHNNLGYVKLMKNDLAAAETNFNNAMSKGNSPVINNNLGVIARLKGDRVKAMEYYNKAGGAGDEVKYNKGIVNILDGEYGSAVANFKGTNDFNAALAQLLNGNADGALQTLNAAEDGKTAEGYYLKAVIAARMDKAEMVASNLKIAIEKDPSLEAKAKKDAEFIKYNF
jgi:Flp pilus assembly protein TadD